MANKTTRSIVLVPEHLDELAAALDARKGRAKVYPSARQIMDAAQRAEQRLDNAGVASRNRVGCHYMYRQAGPAANSYKYWKTVVTYSLRRKSKGWVLTSAGSADVYPKQARLDLVYLTAEAKDAVLLAALSGFTEIPGQAV